MHFFHNVQIFKVMIKPKYFKPAAFFEPSKKFLAFECLVSFSPLVYFYDIGVYRGNFSLFLCIMIVCVQLQPVLLYEGFLVVH